MQHRISDNIHLGKIVTPFESIGDSKTINRMASDFLNADQKLEKIKRLVNKWECGKCGKIHIRGIEFNVPGYAWKCHYKKARSRSVT